MFLSNGELSLSVKTYIKRSDNFATKNSTIMQSLLLFVKVIESGNITSLTALKSNLMSIIN